MPGRDMGWALVLVLCGISASAAGGDRPPGRGDLVLDESAYWRYHVRFGVDRLDSAALKAEGEKEMTLYVRWDRPEAKYLGAAAGIVRAESKFHT